MLSPFVNQSEYIDETFSRLHKNSIESLIAYGVF